MKSLGIHIQGRVQGVWFRKYTRDEAVKLGLSGFVRNEPDGSVYAEVSGPSEMVDRFVSWCHQGSPMSHVEWVDVSNMEKIHTGEFNIRR